MDSGLLYFQGLLNRAQAQKAAVAENFSAGKSAYVTSTRGCIIHKPPRPIGMRI